MRRAAPSRATSALSLALLLLSTATAPVRAFIPALPTNATAGAGTDAVLHVFWEAEGTFVGAAKLVAGAGDSTGRDGVRVPSPFIVLGVARDDVLRARVC